MVDTPAAVDPPKVPVLAPIKIMLAELISSKKFVASITASLAIVLIRVAGKAGWALDPDTAKEVAQLIAGIAASYLIGQGVADHGQAVAAKPLNSQGAA